MQNVSAPLWVLLPVKALLPPMVTVPTPGSVKLNSLPVTPAAVME
jgi:hypothetical protein